MSLPWLVISADGETAARRAFRDAALVAADEKWPSGLAIIRHEATGEQWERRDGSWRKARADDGQAWQALDAKGRPLGRAGSLAAAQALAGAAGARHLGTGETWRLGPVMRWIQTTAPKEEVSAEAQS